MGMVLRSGPATRDKDAISRDDQMGRDAGPSPERRRAAIAMDKIDK